MPLAQTENLAKRSIGHLHDAADAIVKDVKAEARGRFRKTAGAVRGAYGQTRDKAEHIASDVRENARKPSLLSLGAGVALGLAVSLALHGDAKRRKANGKAAEPHAA